MKTREIKPNNTVVCRKDHGTIIKDVEYEIVPNDIYRNDNEGFYAIYTIEPDKIKQIRFFSKIHFYTKQELRTIKLNTLINNK